LSQQSDADRIAAAALAEDGGADVTTLVTVSPNATADGLIEYRDGGVLAGTAFADAVARACRCTITWLHKEGSTVGPGTTVARVEGHLAAILRAERPMLNLLQRACGIATVTRAYVDALRGTGCRILHTRKTAPGLRALDVAAVVAGGGQRHRIDLAHEVMVKDNHWQALGGEGLGAALSKARKRGVGALYVEVESLDQLRVACSAGATRLLVDNQTPETMMEWARLARSLVPGIEIEATGGISLANVRDYAEAGAQLISVESLTSAPAMNISFRVQPY